MSPRELSREQREVVATAKRYRRDGYKVFGPEDDISRPAFLGDLIPNLIAERDDDKVVIEVKQAAAVRGSNEIVELAERVAKQPGWRFELIGLRNSPSTLIPDRAMGSAEVGRLLEQGFPKPAFVLACAMIEAIAVNAFASSRRKLSNVSPRALVRDLVVQGVIGEDTKLKVDNALARRNAILHDARLPAPTPRDVEDLMRIAHDMQREIAAIDLADTE